MNRKIGILLAVATIFAVSVPSVMACGTRTPGFWKTHPDDWLVDSIEVGGVTYSKEDAIGILKTPPKGGDAWIILAKKVIAAKLSREADRPTNPWWDGWWHLVESADDWLEHGGDRAEAINLSEAIDAILNEHDVG